MAQTVSPDQVALARRRYLEGASVYRIMLETGLTRGAVHRCLDGSLDDGSGAPPPPIPRRGAKAPEAVDRKAVVARIWRTANRQVRQIEARLAQSGLAPRERDSDVRALAVLVRTLRELAAFD